MSSAVNLIVPGLSRRATSDRREGDAGAVLQGSKLESGWRCWFDCSPRICDLCSRVVLSRKIIRLNGASLYLAIIRFSSRALEINVLKDGS